MLSCKAIPQSLRRSHGTAWVLVACLLSLCVVSGCEKKPDSLDWPSFSQAVIESGRGAVLSAPPGATSWSMGSASAAQQEAPKPAPVQRIPATKAGILDALDSSAHALKSVDRSAAIASVRALDMQALEPLLEILGDENLPGDHAHRAIPLLLRLGREDRVVHSVWDLPKVAADKRQLSKHAKRPSSSGGGWR